MESKLKIITALNWLEKNGRTLQVAMIPVISIMIIGVYVVVMETGGIQYVFSDAMFIPIILSGLLYGVYGGAVSAIIGAIVLGPFAPIDTFPYEAQLTVNWLYRMAFYLLVGLLTGGARDILSHYLSLLKWRSLHDRNTKLPNRYALVEAIAHVKRHSDPNHGHFLIAFSLANANELICHFGSDSLEFLISQIAYKIQSSLKAGLKTYRVQDNLICILLENVEKIEMQESIESTRKYLHESFVFKNINLHGDIYIGILEFEELRKPSSYYIQRINQVVLHSIEKNEPMLIATAEEEDIEEATNLELLGSLKTALEDKQLVMHFQPKINLLDGKIISAEALIRWNHPKLGSVPPNNFIPRAERSSLINKITMFALDQSMAQVSHWQKDGMHIKVAVNISARNLSQPNFVYNVLQLLDKHELDGRHLELELTESAVMHNESNVIRILNLLVSHGIDIAIDDFGTGYSSLHYLQKLPISTIKIDQSFVLDLLNADSSTSAHIIESTIKLAHKLDMLVVAEGVEDIATLQRLHSMGCDMAQGYYIARPASAEIFHKWHKNIDGNVSFLADS